MAEIANKGIDIQIVETGGENAQYFWHNTVDSGNGEGAGAHITEIPKPDFVADPDNGGPNTLINSEGMNVRHGTDILAEFSGTHAQIGKDDGSRMLLAPQSMDVITEDNVSAFSVKAGSTSKEVLATRVVDLWRHIAHNTPIAYTVPDSIVSGTSIIVGGWDDFDNDFEFEFTQGASGMQSASGVQVAYNGASTFTLTYSGNNEIVYASIDYTMIAPESEVDVPGELNIKGVPFSTILTEPELITTGLTGVVSNQTRAEIIGGGYIDIGKWRYVNLSIMIQRNMSVNDFWRVIRGFAPPSIMHGNTNTPSMACSRYEHKDVVTGYINEDGDLAISSNVAFAIGDIITATGLYVREE